VKRPGMAVLFALLVALLGVLGSGWVPASPDVDTYDDKARLTLGSAVSEVRTIETILRTLHEDRMFRPTAIAQLRYSQSALDTATAAFTARCSSSPSAASRRAGRPRASRSCAPTSS
jgi:hypothetical protein